jgi:hypothetical protein
VLFDEEIFSEDGRFDSVGVDMANEEGYSDRLTQDICKCNLVYSEIVDRV